MCDGLKLSIAPTRKDLMVAALCGFPDTVVADEGYSRLRAALAGTGFTLDGKTKSGHKITVVGVDWSEPTDHDHRARNVGREADYWGIAKAT